MLSLLLGFAQARAKHIGRKHGETKHEAYKIPESLAPFVSKNPRYVKVYRPKESATSATNGGGVTKCVIDGFSVYLYLDDDATKALVSGCSLGAIGAGFIPEALASKIIAAVLGVSGIAISNTNKGRGIIIEIWLLGVQPSVRSIRPQ